jgi:hypothetical protein
MSEILQAMGLTALFVTFTTIMEYKNPSPLTYEERVAKTVPPEPIYSGCNCHGCTYGGSCMSEQFRNHR